MPRQLTLPEVIQVVMKREGLDPDTLNEEYAIQGRLRGRATFRDGGHTWSSHLACAIIDLQNQRVVKFWRQKRKNSDGAEYVRPYFHPDEFEKMVLFAIKRYRLLEAGEYDLPQRAEREAGDAPHDSANCELCDTTKKRCR